MAEETGVIDEVTDEGEPTPQEASEESNETESTEEVKEEESIPARSDAEYYIKLRQQKKAEREAQEVEEPEEDLATRLEKLEQRLAGEADNKELQALFEANPEAKSYEKRIKAYMDHDAYRGVPPEVIYHHLSYNDVRSDKKRETADLEAKQTKSAGSTVRQMKQSDKKTAEDIKNMTDEEFLEWDRKQQMLGRNYS